MRSFFIITQRQVVACLLYMLIVSQAMAQRASGLSDYERQLAKQVALKEIQDYTTILSADAMEGRGAMQRGGDQAARWIADQMKSFGLKPLGENGSYMQAVPLTEKS